VLLLLLLLLILILLLLIIIIIIILTTTTTTTTTTTASIYFKRSGLLYPTNLYEYAIPQQLKYIIITLILLFSCGSVINIIILSQRKNFDWFLCFIILLLLHLGFNVYLYHLIETIYTHVLIPR